MNRHVEPHLFDPPRDMSAVHAPRNSLRVAQNQVVFIPDQFGDRALIIERMIDVEIEELQLGRKDSTKANVLVDDQDPALRFVHGLTITKVTKCKVGCIGQRDT